MKEQGKKAAPEKLERLLHCLQAGDEKGALPLLNRVGMLDRELGQKCLCAALRSCSPEVFRRLLDRVPQGEYAGCWQEWDMRSPFDVCGPGGQIAGTLPALAAAMGKAEHLRLLLDWGCDVNGASLDAATAPANVAQLGVVVGERPYTLRGVPAAGATARCMWFPIPDAGFCGVTPLAAAILFGSTDCVRLLLEREGVWLTETPSVSEALAVRGKPWNTEAHRECRRLVRTREDGTLRPLLLGAAIRRMDAAALRDELCRCRYGREEVVRAALSAANEPIKPEERWFLFAALDERYPNAMRDAGNPRPS